MVRATWRAPSASSPTSAACSTSDWVAARATVNGQPLDTLAPGYALWDVYASQRVLRGLNAFVAIDNLADNQDPNLGKLSATGAPLAIYRPDVGRTVRGGIRWSWAR